MPSRRTRRRRELRRLRDALEAWIWRDPRWCNHEAEYATYTDTPDVAPYWRRAESEARLGPHTGTLPWWREVHDE
jgi:hypothetical protein